MEPIPLVRSFYLNAMTELLERHGAPVYRELGAYNLPNLDREENDLLVPLWAMSQFFAEASARAGIVNAAYDLAIHLDATGLSSAFIRKAQTAPSLKLALLEFCRLVPLEDNRVRFWIENHGAVTRVYSTLVGASQDLHPEASYWVQNQMVVSIVRQFISDRWKPQSMGFSGRLPLDDAIKSEWPSTRFIGHAGACWVDIPRSLMALGYRDGSVLKNAVTASNPSPHPDDLVHSIESLLKSYVGNATLSIGDVADHAGMSVRTLQRNLRSEGQSFKKLIQRVRFTTARTMLRDTNAPVRDIAYDLGYQDPSHFTRAFRQMAGVTPRQFRHMANPA